MSGDFNKVYNPKEVEKRIYSFWEENGYCHPERKGKKFTIAIPPPNITGSLHIGHALNNTLQDILIRRKRLAGFSALWIPGTDHASIGTHNQIEKTLKKEGKTRFDLGREKFLEFAWQWKERYEKEIINQLKSLGCLCDWQRLRFTLDEVCSKAVREAFVRYYEEGLIYRDYRIINWCPRCKTAISDLEVKAKEIPGKLWFIRYPGLNGEDGIIVATTRPETMLGDTAVAVNPSDERYQGMIGKKVILPLMAREIPIITDSLVDKEFGTGAVKVTPAHDPIDFEIGKKNNLPFIKVIDEDAKITKEGGNYYGLSREEARNKILEDLKKEGLLIKEEDYTLPLKICVRCETPIEPLLSLQWFLRMKELADPAIKVVKEGRVRFFPRRWEKVYLDWMENIKDWCLSRQLWWGHRIPVFYCEDCSEIIVSRTDPKECPKCQSKKIRQEEDILDTWFSSALWPFSTLGWPEKTEDFQFFYPTDVLVTDPDIIFLWVARMIFSSLFFTKEIPFHTVYIHSTVLTQSGERMSRSRGIGVDPNLLIEKYGSDALRFTLTYLETQSQSFRFWEERVLLGRNFANKIWNAARLIYPYLKDAKTKKEEYPLTPIDEWVITEFNKFLNTINHYLESYNFSGYANSLYEFFWHTFCDWYLEFSKKRLKERDGACLSVLYSVFSNYLKVLHPVMPFITEEIYQRFNFGKSVLEEKWPEEIPLTLSPKGEMVYPFLDLIKGIRTIRSEMRIDPKVELTLIINPSLTKKELQEFFLENMAHLKNLAGIKEIKFDEKRPPQSSSYSTKDFEFYLPLGEVIDVKKEEERIKKEISALKEELEKIEMRLQDENFLKKAKAEVKEKEEARKRELSEKLQRLENNLFYLK
ncbi:MAG: valine--tRNA ligase [candidate division WOR-3 bacterium]